MKQQQTTKTASQRVEELERGLVSLYQTIDNMARDLLTMKDAIKLLGNKLDSVVKATNRGETLNDEVISKIMVENNVEELKQKVTNLLDQGVISPSETVENLSFVVGRELSEDGTIQNPRMQFVVSGLQEDVKSKIIGSTAGQTIELQDGKWKFEIQEIYKINTPEPTEQST